MPPFVTSLLWAFYTVLIFMLASSVSPSPVRSDDLLRQPCLKFRAGFKNRISDVWLEDSFIEAPGGRIVDDGVSGGALRLEKGEYLLLDATKVVGADQSHDPELDDLGLLPLSATEPLKMLVGRMDWEEILLLPAGDEGLSGREGRLSRKLERHVMRQEPALHPQGVRIENNQQLPSHHYLTLQGDSGN